MTDEPSNLACRFFLLQIAVHLLKIAAQSLPASADQVYEGTYRLVQVSASIHQQVSQSEAEFPWRRQTARKRDDRVPHQQTAPEHVHGLRRWITDREMTAVTWR